MILKKCLLLFRVQKGDYDSKSWLEKITIYLYPQKPNLIEAVTGETRLNLHFKYDPQDQILIIRKPGLSFKADWEIKIM